MLTNFQKVYLRQIYSIYNHQGHVDTAELSPQLSLPQPPLGYLK